MNVFGSERTYGLYTGGAVDQALQILDLLFFVFFIALKCFLPYILNTNNWGVLCALTILLQLK